MANLRLIPGSGPPLEVTNDDALVGRDPGCDVVVADGSVSRRHARIQRRGESWAVVDQGSANGTFIDSQRVAEVTLRHGQELRFGAVSFKVELEGIEDISATIAGVPAMSEATVVSTSPLIPVPPTRPTPPPPPVAKPLAPPPIPPPIPSPPPPPVAKPPAPPSAAQAKERFRPTSPPGAAAAAPPPVPQMPAGPAPAKKGKGPVFWIFAGCCGCLLLGVILGALLGGSVFMMTAAPVGVVREQLKALKAKDDAQACTHLASSASLDCDRLKELAVQHPGLGDNKDSTFWNRSIKNDGATVSGVLLSETGKAEPATFTLVKEGAGWKVVDIRFEGVTVD